MNKITAFFLTIFLGLYFSVSAQVDEFQDDIISLLKINGTVQKYDFEYEKILTSLKIRVAADDTPQSFWDNFRENKKESIDELISILAFAYRKNYTQNEIKELYIFYNTSVGKKLIENNNEFTKEEINIIEDFNSSKLAIKVKKNEDILAADVNDIYNEWYKELFSKGLGALAKAGYTK